MWKIVGAILYEVGLYDRQKARITSPEQRRCKGLVCCGAAREEINASRSKEEICDRDEGNRIRCAAAGTIIEEGRQGH